jgi:hypothetical protein
MANMFRCAALHDRVVAGGVGRARNIPRRADGDGPASRYDSGRPVRDPVG